MSIIKRIVKHYRKIPIGLLNFIAPLYYIFPKSIRYGATYKKEKHLLAQYDKFSQKEILAKQEEELQKLIKYVYEHVPYYKELFDNNNIKPEDIRCKNDLTKIPLLTKEILVKNQEKLISNAFSVKKLLYITTSGSTGTPTGFYVQPESNMRDWVYVEHMFKEYGYSIESKKLILRGRRFKNQDKNLNWQWDAFRRELSINIFEMNPENMGIYCNKIEKYKPQFGYGYLSAMYVLCKYIKSSEKKLKHHMKGFIAISETVSDEQRKFVESVIGAPVLTFYGMSERVVIAKEKNGSYFNEPLYGITELVDNNDSVIQCNNTNGEIVGTSLLNYGMPLIRYKMGDISSWQDYDKSILNNIEGRKNIDVLINDDGNLISMAALEVHTMALEKVYRYQFEQKEKGVVTINILPIDDGSITETEILEIKKTFSDRVDGKIHFNVQIVDNIKPKQNGKFSIVNQHLDVSCFE